MISRTAREFPQLRHCPSSACMIPEPGEAQRKQVREGKQDRTQGLVQMGKNGAVRERPGSCPMTRMLRRAWDRSFSGLWAAALAFLSGRSVTEEDGLTFKHMRWGEGREAKTKKIKRNLKAAPKASILERTLLLNRLVVQVFLFLPFSSQCRPRSLNTLELELDKSLGPKMEKRERLTLKAMGICL